MSQIIPPRTLSGFRDYLPDVMLGREKVLEAFRRVCRSYGFTPIDTPACEGLDILLGKGGDESDKLVYRVRSAKSEKEEMGLRFDLTVPFARFAAQHINELGTPFKRYATGPVWRGERPGHGRYREFWQCDFDTIGTTSNAADIETVMVINDLFEAIGLDKFEIRVNNRMVLNGFLAGFELSGYTVPILRAIDKLEKIKLSGVKSELLAIDGVDEASADLVIRLMCSPQVHKSNNEVLSFVDSIVGDLDKSATVGTQNAGLARGLIQEGTNRLRELLSVCSKAGIPDGRIKIDLSIARGLDYYTGTIYETFLGDLPGIGSVCSGGRYDNLASKYTKQVLPGVGASLGLDRLVAAMEELKRPLLTGQSTPAEVLVVQFDAAKLGEYERISRHLRKAGINVEVYPDAKKVGQQLGYAEKRGFKFALIAGEQEFAAGVWKVKDLAKREEKTVAETELIDVLATGARRASKA